MCKNRVLIVEDSPSFASLLEEMLNDEVDFTVVGVANDGLAALDKISELKPDIIVLDIIMPKLDGLGVLESIKNMLRDGEIDKRPKVLVLSAVGQDGIAKNVIALGADYCMLKPFDFGSFLARLRSFSDANSEKDHDGGDVQALNLKISSILQSIGVPLHIKGFRYISEAVAMLFRNPNNFNKITSVVYPGVASSFDTTSASVERAIRNAIEITLGRGILNGDHAIFGDLMTIKKGRITNSEFISILVEWLKSEF